MSASNKPANGSEWQKILGSLDRHWPERKEQQWTLSKQRCWNYSLSGHTVRNGMLNRNLTRLHCRHAHSTPSALRGHTYWLQSPESSVNYWCLSLWRRGHSQEKLERHQHLPLTLGAALQPDTASPPRTGISSRSVSPSVCACVLVAQLRNITGMGINRRATGNSRLMAVTAHCGFHLWVGLNF